MEKYKVTKKHPALNEGEMRANEHSTYDFISRSGFYLQLEHSKSTIKNWVNRGYIEEIQEPEFTKNDMIEFIQYFCHNNRDVSPYLGSERALNAFNEWMNFKKQKT